MRAGAVSGVEQAQALEHEVVVDDVGLAGDVGKPPVAMTRTGSSSSPRIRRIVPSTRSTRRPDWLAAIVLVPITRAGRTMSTRGSLAARANRASAPIPMPGANTPPRYS